MIEYAGHFPQEAQDWMARRSEAFALAVTRWPGKQMTYGAGKGPLWSEDDRQAAQGDRPPR